MQSSPSLMFLTIALLRLLVDSKAVALYDSDLLTAVSTDTSFTGWVPSSHRSTYVIWSAVAKSDEQDLCWVSSKPDFWQKSERNSKHTSLPSRSSCSQKLHPVCQSKPWKITEEELHPIFPIQLPECLYSNRKLQSRRLLYWPVGKVEGFLTSKQKWNWIVLQSPFESYLHIICITLLGSVTC